VVVLHGVDDPAVPLGWLQHPRVTLYWLPSVCHSRIVRHSPYCLPFCVSFVAEFLKAL
jgi:hypothetical protein